MKKSAKKVSALYLHWHWGSLFLFQPVMHKQTGKSDLVNVLMGTDSNLPYPMEIPILPSAPMGHALLDPQTGKNGDGWQYTYGAEKSLASNKHTSLRPGWMITGSFPSCHHRKNKMEETERASWFSHKSWRSSSPIITKCICRCRYHHWTDGNRTSSVFSSSFPKSDSSSFIGDAYNRGSFIKIIPAQKIIGYSTRYSPWKMIGLKIILSFISARHLN